MGSIDGQPMDDEVLLSRERCHAGGAPTAGPGKSWNKRRWLKRRRRRRRTACAAAGVAVPRPVASFDLDRFKWYQIR